MKSSEPEHVGRVNWSGRLCASLFLVLLVGRGGLLFATDALRLVPADVSGVVVFRNVAATDEKLTAFVRRIHPDYGGFEFGVVSEKTLGLAPGTMDRSKPIVVIVSKPEELRNFLKRRGLDEEDEPYPVIAFTPRQPAEFLKKLSGRENRARRQEGSHGKYYLLMREGVAFFSPRRKGLRMLRGVRSETSLAAVLEGDAQSILTQSDIFVHLPLARWRERISPYVWMATNMMKLGITAQQDPSELEPTQEVVDWFVDGLRDAVDQAESVSVALDLDETTFRLAHRVAFARGGSLAAYLGQVRRGDLDLWRPLPDQPFLMAGVFNWQCPPETSFACRFNRYLWNTEFARKTLPDQKRKKLLACAEACYGGMKGMQFIVTSPPGRFHPVQVFGGYMADDAADVFGKYCYMQEHAGKLLAGLMPGGAGFGGKFKKCRRGGVECLEMEFKTDELSEMMRQGMIGVYGEGARIQQAIAGKHQVVYSIAQMPWGVKDLVKAVKSGRNVGQNPAVRRIRSRLPADADANAVVVMDLGQMFGLLPHLMQDMRQELRQARRAAREARRRATGGDDGEKVPPSETPPPAVIAEPVTKVGPLAGWSCRVRDNALDCQLVMDADDVLGTIELVHAYLAKPKEARTDAKTPSP